MGVLLLLLLVVVVTRFYRSYVFITKFVSMRKRCGSRFYASNSI